MSPIVNVRGKSGEIDGEVVVLDKSGRKDFNLLQNFRNAEVRNQSLYSSLASLIGA